MKTFLGSLRRASIYITLSYLGLLVINNVDLKLSNMWIAYLPMFVGVYAFTLWADRKLSQSADDKTVLNKKEKV